MNMHVLSRQFNQSLELSVQTDITRQTGKHLDVSMSLPVKLLGIRGAEQSRTSM